MCDTGLMRKSPAAIAKSANGEDLVGFMSMGDGGSESSPSVGGGVEVRRSRSVLVPQFGHFLDFFKARFSFSSLEFEFCK